MSDEVKGTTFYVVRNDREEIEEVLVSKFNLHYVWKYEPSVGKFAQHVRYGNFEKHFETLDEAIDCKTMQLQELIRERSNELTKAKNRLTLFSRTHGR